MAVVAVTFQGTRVNAADSNTDWSNLNSTGPAPYQEPQNRYQGTNIINKQIQSATYGGIEYDPGAGAVDMTAANRQLWFVKCVVTDFADLVVANGARITLGSANNAFYHYVVAGTAANRSRFNAWPSQGGFLIFGLNPEVSAWREGTGSGTPSLTAVDYFGFEAAFQNGNSKSENLGLDAIDIGTGLQLTGGGGADPVGTYEDFIAEDQGTVNNRWGVVLQPLGSGSPITCNGRLDIGTAATSASFRDDFATVIYPDGYHGAGDLGLLVDLSQASTLFIDASTHIGLGSSTTEDTRPDMTFTGSSGLAFIAGVYDNFRNITLQSSVDATASQMKCTLLVQNGAEFNLAIIRTQSASGVATLQDPTFGNATLGTGLYGTAFSQSGSGHAIELDTATTYTLSDITFFGYGSDGANDAAIYVSATSGTCTINITDGGDTPTVRTAGATVVINNTVTVSVTVLDADTKTAISGARVLLEADSGGPLAAGTDILSGTTNASGVIEDTGFNYVSDQPVVGKARLSSGAGPFYKTSDITGTITVSGFSTTVLLVSDE
jgi:hypothetical protein